MQTEVIAMEEAVAGLLADNSLTKDCLPYTNGEASAEIPFGVMVAHDSTEGFVELLNTSAAAMATELAGVSVFGQSYAKTEQLGTTGLKSKVTFDVLQRGRIYVQVEDAVAIGDPVRVRAVANGIEVKGAFRTAADGTDCVNISKFARWIRGAGIGELAVVEIDMTNAALAEADV